MKDHGKQTIKNEKNKNRIKKTIPTKSSGNQTPISHSTKHNHRILIHATRQQRRSKTNANTRNTKKPTIQQHTQLFQLLRKC